jgi:CxxC motif-containing protein
MSSVREIVCIVCPNGCRMQVSLDGQNKISHIENALCKKGETYAADEILCPRRTLTSTVRVLDGSLPLASVRTDKPIPKEMILKALNEIRKIELKAPVVYHQVILANLMGSGANLISTREIPEVRHLKDKET